MDNSQSMIAIHLHTILQLDSPEGLVNRLEMNLPPGTSIAELLGILEVHLPPESLIFAANGRAVDLDYQIKAGDKIDLMPAIAGGCPGDVPDGTCHPCFD